jgi:hypothetical protein
MSAANVCSSIRDQLNPDSNVSEVSDSHRIKHLSPMTSMDEGITISMNTSRYNAPNSIRDNLDPDSNVSEIGDVH